MCEKNKLIKNELPQWKNGLGQRSQITEPFQQEISTIHVKQLKVKPNFSINCAEKQTYFACMA